VSATAYQPSVVCLDPDGSVIVPYVAYYIVFNPYNYVSVVADNLGVDSQYQDREITRRPWIPSVRSNPR